LMPLRVNQEAQKPQQACQRRTPLWPSMSQS
jgi:hypothetical protein